MNKSLEEGQTPQKMKIGIIRLIFKGGNHKTLQNQKSITMGTTLGKIIEKYVAKYFSNYLHENNIINKSKYGTKTINKRHLN